MFMSERQKKIIYGSVHFIPIASKTERSDKDQLLV